MYLYIKKYRSVKRERYCRERNAPCRVACYWTMLDACLGKRCEIFHRKKKKKKKEEKEIERIFEKEFLYPEKKSLPKKFYVQFSWIRVRISCIYIFLFFENCSKVQSSDITLKRKTFFSFLKIRTPTARRIWKISSFSLRR